MDNVLAELEKLKARVMEDNSKTVADLTGQSPAWTNADHKEALAASFGQMHEQPRGSEVTISPNVSVVPGVNHLFFVVNSVVYPVKVESGD